MGTIDVRVAPTGDFIKTEILDAHGLTVTEAARIVGVARPTLSKLLHQRASLSGEMALRMEKAFGVSMDTLMRMQTAYDISQTRQAADRIHVRRYRPRHPRDSGSPRADARTP